MPKKFIRFGDFIVDIEKIACIRFMPCYSAIVIQMQSHCHYIQDEKEKALFMKWLETQDVENFEGETD